MKNLLNSMNKIVRAVPERRISSVSFYNYAEIRWIYVLELFCGVLPFCNLN
ncbi:MAG: hypothetical protein JW776_16015 [Candidatus Lokiarchaeota archaeon]|nr:hypothetical protein [Candidatus Lokiarchaeota archaeon]